MKGNVIEKLNQDNMLENFRNGSTVTISLKFNERWWTPLYGGKPDSVRYYENDGCMKVDFPNTYANAHTAIRVVYTDFQCKQLWRDLLELSRVDLEVEVMRALRFGMKSLNIEVPDPIDIYIKNEYHSRFYLKPSRRNMNNEDVRLWSINPLKTGTLCMAHQAYNLLFTGWSVGSIKAADSCLNLFYPNIFTKELLDDWDKCGIKDEYALSSHLKNEHWDGFKDFSSYKH